VKTEFFRGTDEAFAAVCSFFKKFFAEKRVF
jgi:hypothetical protein